MAGETELERLVVRLTGNQEQYEKMLDNAVKNTQHAAEQIGHATDRITTEAVTKGELAARAIERVADKVIELGHEMVHAFAHHEEVEVKLKAALEANGRAVEETYEGYERFAKQISKVTTFGAVATEELLQQAEALGLTGDAAMRAVKNAIALEKGLGRSAEGSIRLTTALEQGNAEMLGRFLPILRKIEDPAQKAAKAQEILGKMFHIAEAQTGTYNGVIEQLNKSIHGLYAEFGKIITEGLKPLAEWTRQAITWFKQLDEQTKRITIVIATVFATLGPILIGGKLAFSGIAAALAFFETTLTVVLGPVGLLVVGIGAIVAGFVELSGGVKGAMENIGKVFSWVKTKLMDFWLFVRPVWRAFEGAASAAFDVIKDVAKEAWDFIKSSLQPVLDWIVAAFGRIGAWFKELLVHIRDGWVEFFIRIEYLFRNWSLFVQIAVGEVKLYFIELWEDLKQGFANLFMNLSRMTPGNLLKAIQNGLDFDKIWTPVLVGAKRLPTVIEGAIRIALNVAKGALDKGFDKFHEQRLKDIFGNANAAGQNAGQDFLNGIMPAINEVKKALDLRPSVKIGTAAAFTALREYLQGMPGTAKGATGHPLLKSVVQGPVAKAIGAAGGMAAGAVGGAGGAAGNAQAKLAALMKRLPGKGFTDKEFNALIASGAVANKNDWYFDDLQNKWYLDPMKNAGPAGKFFVAPGGAGIQGAPVAPPPPAPGPIGGAAGAGVLNSIDANIAMLVQLMKNSDNVILSPLGLT